MTDLKLAVKTYNQYEHIDAFDINTVLSKRTPIKCRDKRVSFTTKDGREFLINMDSERYHVFATSLICACCGLVGSVMLLDRQNKTERPHFNLYGVRENIFILMTQDHILPRSQGGLNDLSNLQTMCILCNQLKKNRNITLEQLKEEYNHGRLESI